MNVCKTRRVPALLLCILLCVGLSAISAGAASATPLLAQASNITVDIVPPVGIATGSAQVSYCVTDLARDGFDSVRVRLGLDGAWRDVTGSLTRWDSSYTGSVTITDNCAVTVSVTDNDGLVYEKMCYINCFENGAHVVLTDMSTEEPEPEPTAQEQGAASASVDPDEPADPTPTPTVAPTALTPDGQGTVLDDATDEDGKEFLTITTPSDNIFYLIIDRERESDNVYFLNKVTESDLSALAEPDAAPVSTSAVPETAPVCTCAEKCEAGAVNTACPVCVLSWKDCAGTEPEPSADPEPEPESGGSIGAFVFVLIVAAAVGGAGYYFKIYRPKHDMADAEDFDELTETQEEPAVNEDEPRRGPDAEPEEPDYPDGYGREEPGDAE